MARKGVTATPEANVSNIIQATILDKEEAITWGYDRCFGKSSFDGGGGYDKEGFDRACI